jgi:hypothetical protein
MARLALRKQGFSPDRFFFPPMLFPCNGLPPRPRDNLLEKEGISEVEGARDQILLKILGEEFILISRDSGAVSLFDLAFAAGTENQRRIFHAGI